MQTSAKRTDQKRSNGFRNLINIQSIQGYDRLPIVLAVLVFVAFLGIWYLLSLIYLENLKQSEKSLVQNEINLRTNSVEKNLFRRATRLDGLWSFANQQLDVHNDIDEHEFEFFAKGIFSGITDIRNVTIAPNGVMHYVYPREGNENVIDLDLKIDPRPNVRADVQRTIETGELVLSDPYELRIGGLGMVARRSVMRNDEFWGLVTMAIDFSVVLEPLSQSEDVFQLNMAMVDNEGKIFYGSPEVLESDPVIASIDVPQGKWVLAGVPEAGWDSLIRQERNLFWLAGILIGILSAGIVYLMSGREIHLQKLVLARTNEIVAMNEQLEKNVADRTIELQDSLEFIREIFDNSSSGMAAYDPTGQCVMANDAMASMIGATLEGVLQQNYHQIESWKQSGLYDAAQAAIHDNESRWIDVHVISSFGKDLWLEVRFTPFGKGTPPNLLITVIDLTDRVIREQTIQQLNDQLQAHTLRLEAANRELEAFTYTVSHDLRAPLRGIDGYTRILMDEYSDRLDEEGVQIGETIRSSVMRMSDLIDGLLTFSRLSRVDLQKRNVKMKELALKVFKDLTETKGETNIQFILDDIPDVLGDETLLHQVWANLISNAIKFSSQRDTPIIEVHGIKETLEIIYQVKDNGAGFDMKYIDKLFGVFQRLHSSDEFEGTGVGLAIVQRIIQRHGGKVWANAEPGIGAIFYFSLPADQL